MAEKNSISKLREEKVEILKMEFDNSTERINLINETMCYVPVKVNENQNEVLSLIDSGSNATIIDKQLLELAGYDKNDIIPWRFGKVKLALGNEAMPEGTIMLKLNILDREFMVETIITDDRRNKLILGIGV